MKVGYKTSRESSKNLGSFFMHYNCVALLLYSYIEQVSFLFYSNIFSSILGSQWSSYDCFHEIFIAFETKTGFYYD